MKTNDHTILQKRKTQTCGSARHRTFWGACLTACLVLGAGVTISLGGSLAAHAGLFEKKDAPAAIEAKSDTPSEKNIPGGALASNTASNTASSSNASAAPLANGAPRSFADISEKLLPAVVNVSASVKATTQTMGDMPEIPQFPEGSPFNDFFKDFMERNYGQGQEMMPSTSLGSGFIIDAAKGLVVTNNHVVKDADEIKVILNDDTTLDAKLVGTDDKTDLAVLKIDAAKHKLSAVSFGDSDVMRVGDWVLAIGNPFGLGGTVTAGIISARQRDIHSGPYDDFIQTDASINRGNSGGPMFNLRGDVIGINTAIFSPSGGSVGIGFAIPSNLAKPVVDQIVQYGRTKRGWLGIKIQTVTQEIADSMNLKSTGGALVASITPDGPADHAKLMQGDVITEFNGKKLTSMRGLPRMVAETPVGQSVPVKIIRNGEELSLNVVVGELEKAEQSGAVKNAQNDEKSGPSKSMQLDGLGVFVNDLSNQLRETYEIPEDSRGIVVTKIIPNSDAAQKGMSAGDVIIEINQHAVTSVAQANALLKSNRDPRQIALLLVDHQGQGDVRFVALRLHDPKAIQKTKMKSDRAEPPKDSTDPALEAPDENGEGEGAERDTPQIIQ